MRRFSVVDLGHTLMRLTLSAVTLRAALVAGALMSLLMFSLAALHSSTLEGKRLTLEEYYKIHKLPPEAPKVEKIVACDYFEDLFERPCRPV